MDFHVVDPYLIMEKIEVSLKNVMDTCMKNNLMMAIDEDVLKFLILKIFQQLLILREAGASHGDVNPTNIMFSYEVGRSSINMDSADVQLIDFGSTGPDGSHYAASPKYVPPDNWKTGINDGTNTTKTYCSIEKLDIEMSTKALHPRKNGSKFDSWSSFITLLELVNFQHPFQHNFDCGNYLDALENFRFKGRHNEKYESIECIWASRTV